MEGIVIFILWAIISSIIFLDYAPYIKDIKSSFDQFLALLIFLIFGPVFMIYNIAMQILDMIMPEGWDNDDDFRK